MEPGDTHEIRVWEPRADAPSIPPPVILVGRAGRGSVTGDLRPAGMRPGQRSGESDASAGDLCTGRVRKSERRGDGDCGAASAAGDGGDNRRLMIRAAAVNGDGLAGAKSYRAGDEE